MDSSFQLEHFLEMLSAECGFTNNTIYSYSSDLKRFIVFCKSNRYVLSQVNQEIALEYIVFLSSKGERTVSRNLSALRKFFSFLVSEAYCSENPFLELKHPKLPSLVPKALSEENILLMKEYLLTHNDLRLSAIFHILYGSGMRVSELLSLRPRDLRTNLQEETYLFRVVGKGRREKLAFINNETYKILKEYLNSYSIKNDEVLFSISRQRVFQLLKELAVAVDLPTGIVSPHKLRHSFATHVLKRGANLKIVQELLGHRDISSTEIYTKVLDKDKEEAIYKYHPLRK